jgi:hypothetical protein
VAQVANAAELRARVDRYLDYLQREWEGIPSLAAEWNTWDEDSRLDFVLEWPIREDRLHQLHEWAEQGVLAPAQRARYDDLQRLLARYRPTVEKLLAE